MPNARRIANPRFFEASTFLKKMVIYSCAFRGTAHQRQFGIPTFRVLTVTTSPARVTAMQDAYHQHLTGLANPGLFLFSTLDALRERGNPLAMTWADAAGREFQLV